LINAPADATYFCGELAVDEQQVVHVLTGREDRPQKDREEQPR
jgi:hypothetical protein